MRPHKDGGFESHYDPRIAAGLHMGPVPDLAVWERWDAVACPVLVLSGAASDILLPETTEEIRRRGLGETIIEIPGVGHTPSLMTDEKIGAIAKFLGALSVR
ncbi:MAG: alpha/beta hydrolase [Alphaproteobacteria bacterium]|nr:alpha/beta hydrolase [Alphaproteobacteria bacterium]